MLSQVASDIVAKMKYLAIGLLLVAAACSDGDESITTIGLGGAQYRVPDAHIVSASREPHQFVRIKPPDHEFELVYDSRTAARSDPFAWPVIFSLNDSSAPDIQRHSVGDLVVVCRRAANPKGGCGIRVQHGGAEWAVLFPDSRRNEARLIRQRALSALSAYEA